MNEICAKKIFTTVYICKIPTYNVLGKKYELLLPYVPISGIIEIFDFTACVYPDWVQLYGEPFSRFISEGEELGILLLFIN